MADGVESNGGERASRGFGSLKSLGEAQLQIQFTLSSMHDTQALGILALNAALLAVAVGTRDLLGHLWWMALIGLFLSSLPCVIVLGRSREQMGPDLGSLFSEAEKRTADEMDELIAKSVSGSIAVNNQHLGAQRRLLYAALMLLGLTLAGSILAILAF